MGDKEKVTNMVLKVNLQCHKCYEKVKKVLYKFPEIRNQIYDEKQNQVKITVVCCNPEKIRDKIRCKGGCAIKSIEIEKPPVKTETPQPDKKTKKEKCKPPPTPPMQPVLVVPAFLLPVRACCMVCYRGHAGGPCYGGCGGGPSCSGCGSCGGGKCGCGRCSGGSCGCGSCGYCFSEENPSACTTM